MEPKLTREFNVKYGYYTIYLEGKFLARRDSFDEVREVYAEYGQRI